MGNIKNLLNFNPEKEKKFNTTVLPKNKEIFCDDSNDPKVIKKNVCEVYEILSKRGYQATNQIVGYLLSGDPTYITSFKDARKRFISCDRNEVLKQLVEEYVKNIDDYS